MSDSFRSFLYPIGLIATLLFGLRFWLQWIYSEKRERSITPKSFWKISLVANAIMVLHSLIQMQYPVSLIQSINGTIAWRNLNLTSARPKRFRTMLFLLAISLLGVSALFFCQSYLLGEGFSWMRPPKLPWAKAQTTEIALFWHLLGSFGLVLFATRFWLQWYFAEKSKKSELSPSFFWLSFFGATCALCYFIRLGDIVNILAYGTGLIPYLRNIVLLKKRPQEIVKGKFFIFAGEKSGDILGGELLQALKARLPHASFYGVGGEKMEEEGIESLLSLHDFQVMGISAVLKKLPKLFISFCKLKRAILQKPPEAVILIDYPDFNMLLAKALKKGKYPGKVIQYVCPSVWAWRKGRVKSLSKNLDLLLSILPFEKRCFSAKELKVKYIGHPLVQTTLAHDYDLSWKKSLRSEPLIALFPGSRMHEIESNLPVQLEAAFKLKAQGQFQFAISIAEEKLEEKILEIIKKSPFSMDEILLVPGKWRYELMREAKCALATCGTVILELGLHKTPTVVTYGLTNLNYYVGRYLFKIRLPAYSLVNIICEENIFPEFVHNALDSQKIADALKELVFDSLAYEKAVLGCQRMQDILFEQNASKKAADAICEVLEYAMPLS